MKRDAIEYGQLGPAGSPAAQQHLAVGQRTMSRVSLERVRSVTAAAALLAGLFGCGSEGPLTQPPPPPAPVFQPQQVEVELGASGSKVTLMTTQGGGFTLDGEPFHTGGSVTAANGNEYTLDLVDGQWTARYNAPEVEVTLGIREETVVVARAEDGTYRVGDMAVFGSGTTVAASDGAEYSLSLSEDGVWTATFVEPTTRVPLGSSGETIVIRTRENGRYRARSRRVQDGSIVRSSDGSSYRLTLSADGAWTAVFQMSGRATVVLGTSGSTVEIETLQDGTHRIGQQPIADGDTVQAANGNSYTLALSDQGQWTATYQAERVRVTLGEHGGRVALFRGEDGNYTFDGNQIESGTVLEGKNGGQYQLILGPDGAWTAEYQAQVQTVPLGTSGVLVLTELEDGTWTNFKRDFEDGKTLRAENDSRYVLRYRNGFWSAEFVPDELEIVGTDLVATWLEDRSGYRIGTSALLPRDGTGNITVDGAMYHVWKDKQILYASRFDKSPLGNSAARGSYRVGTGDLVVALIEDDEDTIENESKTAILVGGGEFPVEQLLETGAASFDGNNIVAKALGEITLVREDWQALLEVLDDDRATLQQLSSSYQAQAQEIVDSIFGPDKAVLRARTDPDALLSQLSALIEALSSEEAFAEATREEGQGVLAGASLSEAEAKEVFAAVDLRSRVIFRAVGETRYGVVRTEGRDGGHGVNDLALHSDESTLGAFAYSTTEVTQRSRHVQSYGSATYSGETTTVSGDGTVYVGDIELEVRFGNRSVGGLITNIESEEGEPWVYRNRVVEATLLPDAMLLSDASWTRQVRPNDGAVVFYQDQFARASYVGSSFRGRLLGVGDDSGSQAAGIWSIGESGGGSNYLAGSFGLERVAGGVERGAPGDEQADPTGTVSRTVVAPAGTEIEDGVLTLRGTLFGPNLETTETEEQWDDEVQPLEDGQRIEDTYQLTLADLFLRQASVKGYLGRNLMDLARDEIARLRERLVTAISLGEEPGFGLELRRETWDEINTRVRARLFGTGDDALPGTDYRNDPNIPDDDLRKWSSGYPVIGQGRPDDEAALDAVDAVLAALASPEALAAAVKQDGRGVFTRDDGAPFRPAGTGDIEDIWSRAEARLEAWLGSTEYTRFGAWRKQTAPNAWSDYRDRLENRENGPAAFAYSQLPQAAYTDSRFPLGGSATYQGKTVAVQQSAFYEGRIEMSVRWHLDLQGEDEAGILTAVISDLQDQGGILLAYSDSDGGVARQRDIEGVVFGGIRIRADSENLLYFAEAPPATLRILFADQSASVDSGSNPTISSSIEGKFLGRSPGGPQGVIGIWSLRDAGETRVGVGDKLHGAFGAEFRP